MNKLGLALLCILLMALLISTALADPPIGDPPFWKYPSVFDYEFDVPDESYLALGPGQPNPPRGTTYPDGKWYSAYWGHLSPESYARVEDGSAKLKTVSIDHSFWIFGGTMVNQGRASHLAVQVGHFQGFNVTPYAYSTPRIIFNYGETIPSGRLWLDVEAKILDRAVMNYENPLAAANLGFNFQFQPEFKDSLGNVFLEDYDNPDFFAGGRVFPKVVCFDVFLSQHTWWLMGRDRGETPVGTEFRHITSFYDADLHVQRVGGEMPDTNTWYTFKIDLGHNINRALQMTEDHYYNIVPYGGGPLGSYTLNRLILRNIQLYTEASGALIEAQVSRARIYEEIPLPPGGGGSGCPFVYAWNGTQYVVDNNLLGDSEVSNGADVEDYYKLEQTLARKDGKCNLLIKEFEQEHSYIDQVKLMAVDHESIVHVALSPTGQILTYKNPNIPVSVTDNYGNSQLDLVQAADGNYFRGYPQDYLLLDFGNLDVSKGAKLVFRADIEFKKEYCIHVQVLNATKQWMDIAAVRTRVYWATEIVDLSGYLPDSDGELKVRLYFTGIHILDYVGLDTSKQDDFTLHYATLASAVHSQEGDVKTKLTASDDVYAELIPGQQIEFKFTLPQNSEDTRTYIIYTEGHYYKIQ